MPDGSRDLYVGLGAQSAPRYEGASGHRITALPVLQMQWSNGIFISGMSVGMHLSQSPSFEFGPLAALAAGRDASGSRLFRLGTGGANAGSPGGPPTTWLPPGGFLTGQPVKTDPEKPRGDNRLEGMENIERRFLYGGFANYYVTPRLRLTTNALYGAGNDKRGWRMHVSLQHLSQDIAPHHSVALSGGVTFVNRAYNQAYFGVTKNEAEHSINQPYEPDGGLEDVRVGVRWNWTLSPSWMLTSGAQVSRLLGDAKNSPLVERPTNVSVATALAYRF
jgi:outer membrane scaffolding protein for murein synthesis (MipA/OmpV family)